MQYRWFEPIGKQVSVICMGSTAFGTDLTGDTLHEILDAYVALGGNFIDTARVYGDFARHIGGLSEKAIGEWLRQRGNRESLVIGTKGGHPPLSDMRLGRLDSESLRCDLSESLDALGVEYVDLYWLHRDDEAQSVGAILETLNRFVSEGYIRAFGASNWSPMRIYEANRYAAEHGLQGFCANQPQWSLAKPSLLEDPTLRIMDLDTYRMHKETNLACMPFSSQAKGFFSKLFEGGQEALSPKARNRFLNEQNLRVYEILMRIREETGMSIGALALAFLTSQPFPVFPIVGVSRLGQVEALREAGDAVMCADDLAALNALTV